MYLSRLHNMLNRRRGRARAPWRMRGVGAIEALESRALLASGIGSALPNQLIVAYRGGADAGARSLALARSGASSAVALTSAMGGAGVELVTVGPGVAVSDAMAALRRDPSVAYVEPNWVLRSTASSNDPQYLSGALWGTYGDASSPVNAYGSQAAEAWGAGFTGSSTVYVGIIDEGIMTTHQDLAPNIWTNPFDPMDGIDNDGNGYVDDTSGWDFFNNDRTVYDGTVDDHGTHVAGIVGAVGGNALGVAGVNWNVRMISAKFLGPLGGTTAGAIQAIDYITDLKLRHGLNIVATNNSWSGGGYSQALFDAITRAAKADILFVASAGNGGADGVGDNNDALYTYPANFDTTASAGYDAVISVAAIASNGNRAGFSNFGAKSVDLGAPGVGIMSTVPGAGNKSAYKNLSGTSMATPFVTGAAALYKSIYPNVTATQIKQAILATAAPTKALAGKSVTGGRLDIGALVSYAPGGGSSLRGASVAPVRFGVAQTPSKTRAVATAAPTLRAVRRAVAPLAKANVARNYTALAAWMSQRWR